MLLGGLTEAALPNLAPSSCNVTNPQDQIMLESEKSLVSYIVTHSAVMLMYCYCCSADAALTLSALSRVQAPSSLNRLITSTPSFFLR